MHWEAHKEWANNKKLVKQALEVARQLQVPVLLHTGNFETCHAGLFEEFIARYPDLTFVLAHGRPIDEAIDLLDRFSNVYIDTAFMPEQDLKLIAESGYDIRILFGTDAPINEVFYSGLDTTAFIRRSIESVRLAMGDKADEVLSRCIY